MSWNVAAGIQGCPRCGGDSSHQGAPRPVPPQDDFEHCPEVIDRVLKRAEREGEWGEGRFGRNEGGLGRRERGSTGEIGEKRLI